MAALPPPVPVPVRRRPVTDQRARQALINKSCEIWEDYHEKEDLRKMRARLPECISYGFFQSVIDEYQRTRVVPTAKALGRPKKIGSVVIHTIEFQTLTDAKISAGKLQEIVLEQCNISLSKTAINQIRRNIHFDFRPPRHRQALSEQHVKIRYQFAVDTLSRKLLDQYTIVFSDESRFVKGNDGRWVWRRKGEPMESQFEDKTKFPVSVMVWAAVGHNFKTKLIFVEGTLDAEGYRKVMVDADLFAKADGLFGQRKWMYMQDGAPCHTAAATLKFLEPLVEMMLGWPPNSPDLNPIEMIWAVMKHQLNAQRADTKADFKRVLNEVWEALEQERVINPLVDSFRARLELVQRMGGQSIQPYLHGSMSSIGSRVFGPFPPPPRTFSEDEDRRLLELHRVHGNRWTKIGGVMSLDPAVVRNRIKTLEGRARQGPFLEFNVRNDGQEVPRQPDAGGDENGLAVRAEALLVGDVPPELKVYSSDEESDADADEAPAPPVFDPLVRRRALPMSPALRVGRPVRSMDLRGGMPPREAAEPRPRPTVATVTGVFQRDAETIVTFALKEGVVGFEQLRLEDFLMIDGSMEAYRRFTRALFPEGLGFAFND